MIVVGVLAYLNPHNYLVREGYENVVLVADGVDRGRNKQHVTENLSLLRIMNLIDEYPNNNPITENEKYEVIYANSKEEL